MLQQMMCTLYMQDWGLECNLLLLLLAAFFCTNLLSLIYLAIIAIGMAAPSHVRGLTWRFGVLPLLAVILAEQYSLYIGPPPPWDQGQPREMNHHSRRAEQPSVRASLDADLPRMELFHQYIMTSLWHIWLYFSMHYAFQYSSQALCCQHSVSASNGACVRIILRHLLEALQHAGYIEMASMSVWR